MSIALGELASLVGGTLHGDPQLAIHGAAILRDVQAGEITLAGPNHVGKACQTPAAALLVTPGIVPPEKPYIVVSDLHAAFTRVVARFRPPRASAPAAGVSATADISPTARLGAGVVVHPGASVGDEVVLGDRVIVHSGVRIAAACRLGDDVELFPNVVLYEGTVIGNRSIIHAGAVLGAYGFGYQTVQGKHERGAQLGHVEIGDDVEIGANSTIDRGTYGPTVIGDGTKIDNLVMIAHNCRIGRHNLIASQTGIAGSCTTGDYVVLGGQVGLRDHVNVAAGVMLGAKAGVMNDIKQPGKWFGIPAKPDREQLLELAHLSKLPAMRKELAALKKQVAELAALLATDPGDKVPDNSSRAA